MYCVIIYKMNTFYWTICQGRTTILGYTKLQFGTMNPLVKNCEGYFIKMSQEESDKLP